jgi:hypothetical protein
MIGEPDAGNPPVRFDEGMQETDRDVPRLRPTLQSPQLLSCRLLNVFRKAQLRLDAAFSLAGFLVSTNGRIGVSAEAIGPRLATVVMRFLAWSMAKLRRKNCGA